MAWHVLICINVGFPRQASTRLNARAVSFTQGVLSEAVMKKIENSPAAPISRRTLLAGGVAAGSATVLGASGAQAMIKVSQASVAYKTVASAGHNCGACKLFEAPAGCRFVDGPISPYCSCRIWLGKVG